MHHWIELMSEKSFENFLDYLDREYDRFSTALKITHLNLLYAYLVANPDTKYELSVTNTHLREKILEIYNKINSKTFNCRSLL